MRATSTATCRPQPWAMRCGARAMGWRGFNCSIPHKIAVIDHLDALAPSAALIGAVNCVVLRDGRLVGENTDGQGFLDSLRTVAEPAGSAQAEAVRWLPRHCVRADRHRRQCHLDRLFPDVGAMPDLDPERLRPHMVVADVIPNPPRTALLEAAVRRGCVPLDGLGMLVNQGLISIAHWTGRAADAGVMRVTLEGLFGG